MGTFILAFIGNGFVRSAQRLTEHSPLLAPVPPTWQRRLLVVVYFAAIVSCVTLFGVMVRAPDAEPPAEHEPLHMESGCLQTGADDP